MHRNTYPAIRIQLPTFQKSHHYEVVSQAIAYLRSEFQSQPSLADVASRVNLSSQHLLEVFHQWAGITPKQLLKVITLDHAKKILLEGHSNLETSIECGLSGPGRLHDLFVTIDAVTPGEFKTKGVGLQLDWGLHKTPFGNALIMATPRGLSHLFFPEDGGVSELLAELRRKWTGAVIRKNPASTQSFVDRIFYDSDPSQAIPLLLKGTPFQLKVWQALLEIPNGNTTAYSVLARELGEEKAHRACASAVGDNPISYLIPCHRVLRKNLNLGGYRWGLDRKVAILATELR